MDYITPIDVAGRLVYRKQHWLHGKPKVSLIGGKDTFGTLRFDFGDEIVDFKIFIKERQVILDAAQLAVENFNKLVGILWEQ